MDVVGRAAVRPRKRDLDLHAPGPPKSRDVFDLASPGLQPGLLFDVALASSSGAFIELTSIDLSSPSSDQTSSKEV